jgi:hypothetical protein
MIADNQYGLSAGLAFGFPSEILLAERRHFRRVIGLTCFFLTAIASLPFDFDQERYVPPDVDCGMDGPLRRTSVADQSRTICDRDESLSRFACTQCAPPEQRYFRRWLLNFWKP